MSLALQLQAYLDERSGCPFSWARSNCCHFAAAWVQVATGTDPMAGLTPVTSAFRARMQLRRLGAAAGLAGAWTAQWKRQPVAPALAQLGDVVLVRADTVPGGATPGQTMGICAGATAAILGSDGSVLHVPMSQAIRAWPLKESTWHSGAR